MEIISDRFLPYIFFDDKSLSYIPMQIFLVYTGLVSLITFIAYGADKAKAKANGTGKNKRRIPERVLLILAFSGGALGAAAGMLAFHHKTRKRKFGILVPVSVILWVLLLLYTVYLGIMGKHTDII